mmetsp:Transcript_37912/g.109329  ORF Transcript_37912/g.109329 Transcript_37912/m.109329 type:complete len:211 (-) Transcript_37912:909-1541(-)
MRLPTKPGQFPTRIGHFSITRPHSIIEAMVRSDVLAPRTFSSSFITFAGEKKCVPMTNSGRVVAPAIASMFRAEVLEQMKAPGLQTSSSFLKICFFVSMSSNTASTTKSQGDKSLYSSVPFRSEADLATASAVREPRFTDRSQFARMAAMPFCNAPSLTSRMVTWMPASAQHMAMPPPMRPPPMMPTDVIFCGFVLTPSILPPARSLKNM